MAASGSRQVEPSSHQGQPGHTLYCKNLNDRIKKNDLRRNLYALFSSYGPILDIVALRGMKNKGQAHIVFREISGAQSAMRGLQGFAFCGKEIVLEWARTPSRKVVEMRARELGQEDGYGVGIDASAGQSREVGSAHGLVDNKGRLISKPPPKAAGRDDDDGEVEGDEMAMDVTSGKTKRELDQIGESEGREHKRFHSSVEPT